MQDHAVSKTSGMSTPAGFGGLLRQSVDTLASFLADQTVPAAQRADIALRLLELGLGRSDPMPAPSLPTGGSPAPPPPFVLIHDFLAPDQHAAVVDIAVSHQGHFEKSSVTTNVEGYRESHVLHATAFPALYDMMKAEVTGVLPSVLDRLAHPAFTVTQVEMQMTAHGDGAFFKVHDDASSPDTQQRELTYVYYFQASQPRGFSGGALRLYPTPDGTLDTSRFRDVDPLDNAIIFFNSRTMHEVLPVQVPSGAFQDSRFTLNGWLHR